MQATSTARSPLVPVNGYDFARSVLDQEPDRGVEILLQAAGENESDWLEKKAAVYRSENKDESFRRAMESCPFEQREQKKDRLNLVLLAEIAQAIVAIHNSRGGVLFIGIDDKTNAPVSFEDNDGGDIWRTNGKGDYVLKAVLGRLVRENGEFRLDHETLIVPVEAIGLVPKWCRYKDADVLALLIPPLAPERNPLEVTHIENNSPWRSAPRRSPGDVGEVKKGKKIDAWIGSAAQLADFHHARQERFLNQTDLASKLKQLGLSVPISFVSPIQNPRREIISTVDRPRTANFVGRDRDLEALHRLLSEGKIPVVTGPGGTGKTELVLQYADWHKTDYPGGLFQVNMEGVKDWENAFLRLLKICALGSPNLQELLSLKHDDDNDETAEATGLNVLKALSYRSEQLGRILLVLDNVESVRTFFRAPVLQKVSIPTTICIVATARSSDIVFCADDKAVDFHLPDLDPDDALTLLLRDKPASSTAERQAAMEVARLLDFRALHLRAVPALLDDPYSPLAGSYEQLAKELQTNLLSTVDSAMEDYGEGERTPSALWILTRESLARHPAGSSWIKLAHAASFFSPDGFRSVILRHLWGAFASQKFNTDIAFKQALDILHRHGILDDAGSGVLLMHRLSAAVLRRSARKSEIGLESEIGKVLAGFDGMGPMDWLGLIDSVSIVKNAPQHVLLTKPLLNDGLNDASIQVRILISNSAFQDAVCWDSLNGSEWATVISEKPQFSNKCIWERLDGRDWADLLSRQPQFADKCDWGKMDGSNWAILLSRQPDFADKCSWERLSGFDWAHLLCSQPQFANRCPWGKFDGQDWAILLSGQPQYADRCPWEILDGHAWSLLLQDQPKFIEKCSWEQFSEWDWVDLLENAPQFAAHCPWGLLQKKIPLYCWVIWICKQPEFACYGPWESFGGDNWAQLLSMAPNFQDRCNWAKLENSDWAFLLGAQPQFADRCPWEQLDGNAWVTILSKQIQFVGRCPWQKLTGTDWANLLCERPQFAGQCPWDKFNGRDWSHLLGQQPQFAGQCPWDKLDGKDWSHLLGQQPQFTERCPWEKFDGEAWASLLGQQPQFAKRCRWDSLTGFDWGLLIGDQPQFAARCPFDKLDPFDWAGLLATVPEFADRCPWERFNGHAWASLLLWNSDPSFPERCKWELLNGRDWSFLLREQPQFSDHCSWEKLDGRDWAELLEKQPQFADHCPREKLGDENWKALLSVQPQLAIHRTSSSP